MSLNDYLPDVSDAINMYAEGLTYVNVQASSTPDTNSFYPTKTTTEYKIEGVIRNVTTPPFDPTQNIEILFDSEIHVNKTEFSIVPSTEDRIVAVNGYAYIIKQIREISNYYKFYCKRILQGVKNNG